MSVFTFEAAQHEALMAPPPACPRARPPPPLPQDDSPVAPLAPSSQQPRPSPAVHQAVPLAQHLPAQKHLLPAWHHGTAVKWSQTIVKHAASHTGPSMNDQPFHCSGPLRSACTQLGCQSFVSPIGSGSPAIRQLNWNVPRAARSHLHSLRRASARAFQALKAFWARPQPCRCQKCRCASASARLPSL